MLLCLKAASSQLSEKLQWCWWRNSFTRTSFSVTNFFVEEPSWSSELVLGSEMVDTPGREVAAFLNRVRTTWLLIWSVSMELETMEGMGEVLALLWLGASDLILKGLNGLPLSLTLRYLDLVSDSAPSICSIPALPLSCCNISWVTGYSIHINQNYICMYLIFFLNGKGPVVWPSVILRGKPVE